MHFFSLLLSPFLFSIILPSSFQSLFSLSHSIPLSRRTLYALACQLFTSLPLAVSCFLLHLLISLFPFFSPSYILHFFCIFLFLLPNFCFSFPFPFLYFPYRWLTFTLLHSFVLSLLVSLLQPLSLLTTLSYSSPFILSRPHPPISSRFSPLSISAEDLIILIPLYSVSSSPF